MLLTFLRGVIQFQKGPLAAPRDHSAKWYLDCSVSCWVQTPPGRCWIMSEKKAAIFEFVWGVFFFNGDVTDLMLIDLFNLNSSPHAGLLLQQRGLDYELFCFDNFNSICGSFTYGNSSRGGGCDPPIALDVLKDYVSQSVFILRGCKCQYICFCPNNCTRQAREASDSGPARLRTKNRRWCRETPCNT